MTTVAVLQAPAALGRPDQTRARYERLLTGAGADVVVLPELALTGYDLSLPYPELAEDEDGPTTAWASSWARTLGAAVVVGLPLRVASGVVNAVAIVSDDGVRAVYAKRHLWGAEANVFVPGGASPPLVEVAGLGLAPLICFDVTHPEEGSALRGRADLITVSACWPRLKAGHAAAFRDVCRAVACQTGAAVAGANQVGRCRIGDPVRDANGAGRSLVTLPYRRREARCPARGSARATLEVDPQPR